MQKSYQVIDVWRQYNFSTMYIKILKQMQPVWQLFSYISPLLVYIQARQAASCPVMGPNYSSAQCTYH